MESSKRKSNIQADKVKLRSYGLSFHDFRPRFALFPIVGTGRIEVARGLVSASVASHVMAVNSSDVKGGGSSQTASVHPFTRVLKRDLPNHAPLELRDWSEFHYHSPHARTSSDLRFYQTTRHTNKA
ncbi:hypothetical protein AVEN_20582-1 [Araneus ventricosus]|uniref:Uncharacterized protein n=1 Tax=Araneus ventricosus TaxID=182803 RepID=A0A4Y2EI89_ARAVE|nr:hypothetical protein AVEN_20582-1 [Araneus ventricosus]